MNNLHLKKYAEVLCPDGEYGGWVIPVVHFLEHVMQKRHINCSATDVRSALELLVSKTSKRTGDDALANYIARGALNDENLTLQLSKDDMVEYQTKMFGRVKNNKLYGCLAQLLYTVTNYFGKCSDIADSMSTAVSKYHDIGSSPEVGLIVAIVCGEQTLDELKRMRKVQSIDIDSSTPLRLKVSFMVDNTVVESVYGKPVKELYSEADGIIRKYAETLPSAVRERIGFQDLMRLYICNVGSKVI